MSTRYEVAVGAIDAAHALDPKQIDQAGVATPYELHYAQKCSAYLSQRAPDASETLRLAVRAQHFRRWEVPRSSYPPTRAGYHAWRAFAKKRQAELVAEICLQAGYGEADAERVGALVRKEGLGRDAETQVLEDVACLVFLDDQLEAFEREHAEEKMVGILRKTWRKMSARGHELALGMDMEGRRGEVLRKALEGGA